MFKLSKRRGLTVLCGAVSALALSLGAVPAHAATARMVSVGSSPSVMAMTSYQNFGNTIAISYSPNFTNHTTYSVNVTTFRVCYSETGGGSKFIRPVLTSPGGVRLDFGARVFNSGTCWTYSTYRTFSATPGYELFRITGYVSGGGGPDGATVGGFYR